MNNFSLKGYKVMEMMGEGAFSKVYRVQDRKLGTYYAAKRLLEKCESIDDANFCSEVKLIKAVPSHPNLLSIVGLVHENKCLTLIMNLMDMSLYDLIRLRKHALSENRARKILLQIVRGLDHLHRNGVFHRDVKPENILVKHPYGIKSEEIVQLADFGTIACIADSPPYTSYIATRWYRAPECLLTEGYYGPKMDVWAVGCCFYEMLTRKALFPGESTENMLELIHDLLGTPSRSLLQQFKHISLENYNFPKRYPLSFLAQLPLLSACGIDLLKKTIAYHPDQRISASRLLNHVYFDDLTNRKLTTFSLNFQNLNSGKSKTEPKSKFPLWQRPNCRYRGTSIQSRDSSLTSNTVHCFSIEDQSHRNRTLERMWGMHDGPEKQHLFRQIRRCGKT